MGIVLFGFRLFRDNRYGLSVALAFFELYDARNLGEQRMVFAHADILARVYGCATLADNYIARYNTAATRFLNTQSASR